MIVNQTSFFTESCYSKDRMEPTLQEIIFLVEEDPEGGYTARALGISIFTEADTLPELQKNIKEAISCYFDEGKEPKVVRLHYVHDEVIAV